MSPALRRGRVFHTLVSGLITLIVWMVVVTLIFGASLLIGGLLLGIGYVLLGLF